MNCSSHMALPSQSGMRPCNSAKRTATKPHKQHSLAFLCFAFLSFFFFFFAQRTNHKKQAVGDDDDIDVAWETPELPRPQATPSTRSFTHTQRQREREREQRGKHQTHKPKAPRTNKHQASSSSLLLLHKTKTLRDQRRELVRDNPAETNRAEQRQQVFSFPFL